CIARDEAVHSTANLRRGPRTVVSVITELSFHPRLERFSLCQIPLRVKATGAASREASVADSDRSTATPQRNGLAGRGNGAFEGPGDDCLSNYPQKSAISVRSATVPPRLPLRRAVTVAPIIRKAVLHRLVVLSVIAAVSALTPVAHASPPDQSWIGGLYDNADFDDVILFVTIGLGDIQPSLRWSSRVVEPVVELVSLADIATRTVFRFPSAPSRAPPLA